MKLMKIKTVSGKIKVETGLHIGAGNDVIEIGGMDNPIIRDPRTRLPYIPGSSLKGKMRSLLEWKLGKVKENQGFPCNCGKNDCPVCRVYGVAIGRNSGDNAVTRGPTRLIVRDALLSEEFKDKLDTIIEEKSEVLIDRIKGVGQHPRSMERVAPEVTFDFELSYRVLNIENDNGIKDEELFRTAVLDVLKMVEHDYLGGGGSRGNGKIKFIDLKDENGNEIKL